MGDFSLWTGTDPLLQGKQQLWTAVTAARGSVCVHASMRVFRGKTELRCASHTLILSLADDEGSRSRMMELD